MLARAKTLERFPNNILLLQLDVLVPDTTSAVVWSKIVGYGTDDVGSPEIKSTTVTKMTMLTRSYSTVGHIG